VRTAYNLSKKQIDNAINGDETIEELKKSMPP
jgi:hypothetical protein